jgi:hypothetical protein
MSCLLPTSHRCTGLAEIIAASTRNGYPSVLEDCAATAHPKDGLADLLPRYNSLVPASSYSASNDLRLICCCIPNPEACAYIAGTMRVSKGLLRLMLVFQVV